MCDTGQRGVGVGNLFARVGAAGCLVASIGCFQPPAEAQARLEQTREEGVALGRALDQVEERLLGNQAKIQLWQELEDRHREVTQVACTNSAFHLTQMGALKEQQAQKVRRKKRGEVVTFQGTEGGMGG